MYSVDGARKPFFETFIMATKQATGVTSYKDGILKIVTQAKRGKKFVPHTTYYLVEDARPDPAVASPAYSLTKGELVTAAAFMSAAALESGASEEFVRSKEVYHVSFSEWGWRCDCPHGTYRGANSEACCKHTLAVSKVAHLLPRSQP